MEVQSVERDCTHKGLAAIGSMAYVKKFKKEKKASVVRCHKARGQGVLWEKAGKRSRGQPV